MDTEKYRLIGKYMEGSSIIGLEVADNGGNSKALKVKDVHTLIRRGLVEGCTIVEYKDNNYIKSTESKISQLPLMNNRQARNMELTIRGRVFKDGRLIGYTAMDRGGKMYRLSKDKVWELASHGGVTNISATINNGMKILRGKDGSLSELLIVQV